MRDVRRKAEGFDDLRHHLASVLIASGGHQERPGADAPRDSAHDARHLRAFVA
jgi:hypothetical protein